MAIAVFSDGGGRVIRQHICTILTAPTIVTMGNDGCADLNVIISAHCIYQGITINVHVYIFDH